MSRIDLVRASRGGATVVLTHLIQAKALFETKVFCLFEGDDSKYYSSRIDRYAGYSQDKQLSFTCGGKAEVLRLLRLVEKSVDLKQAKTLFFVDRDFDEELAADYSEKIYETNCYSIENFYSTELAFSNVLRSEFKYNDMHPEYGIITELYRLRRHEFHQAITLFNAWIACQRDYHKANPDSQKRVLLSGFKLNCLIPLITIRDVVSNYDIDKIHGYFKDAQVISEEILQAKIDEFNACDDKGAKFRGKFEMYFLRKFLESLLSEVHSKNSLFAKMPGVHLVVSKDNIISELAQYADTPNSLVTYLVQRIAA